MTYLVIVAALLLTGAAHAEQLASPPFHSAAVAPHKAKARWLLLVWKPRNRMVEPLLKPRPLVEVARGEKEVAR